MRISGEGTKIVFVALALVSVVLFLLLFFHRRNRTYQIESEDYYTAIANEGSGDQNHVVDSGKNNIASSNAYEIPQCVSGQKEQLICHVGYTVSYNQDWHLPNWVAYELTSDELVGMVARSNEFLPDPQAEGDPVISSDYSHSGYDRGHMAPAADMKWSEQAMRESFYMTNICPQNRNNNAGDWKSLEELVRDLANSYGNVYIAAGPIVKDTSVVIGTIRRIVVPSAFYKVLLRQKEDGNWTAIGFIMPNEAGSRPLMTYMVTVDDVENIVGINFFHNLPDNVEEAVESDFEISDWTI